MNFKVFTASCAITASLSFPFTTCRSNRPPDKMDTLVVTHHECTECLDAYILNGSITFPKNIDTTLLYSKRDIILQGKSPYKNITIGDEKFQGNFQINGIFKGVDSSNAVGKVIVFRVYNWKKI